ncbi:hypothetical protein ACFV8T_43180 [Streptomyces sp. NPDC059832]|uniref:hypothetical protein n=1 Tax=Streptomyces sp. NPDC059832 TaxID=3346966 RepID=UPI0036600AA5
MQAQEVHRYSYWGEVPAGTYMTKSQLQRLTLPRQPGGPVRARVEGRDGAGRRGVFDLYLVKESEPTSASTAQLAAAAARRTTTDRVCNECGACPDQPCTPWGDTGHALCQTCTHIERLRTAQLQVTERRAHVQQRAAELLEQDLAVLHITYTDRGITASGRRCPRQPCPSVSRQSLRDSWWSKCSACSSKSGRRKWVSNSASRQPRHWDVSD